MSSPTSRSHDSLSPDASQAHSMAHDIAPLKALVSHLLASKRSLSSISTVWRANEIVTSARSALEESAILSARTLFLRDGVSEQAKILRKLRGGVENVYKEGQRELEVHTRGCADVKKKANSCRTLFELSMMRTPGWNLQWMYCGLPWWRRYSDPPPKPLGRY
jgi:autophagy-related protein 17